MKTKLKSYHYTKDAMTHSTQEHHFLKAFATVSPVTTFENKFQQWTKVRIFFFEIHNRALLSKADCTDNKSKDCNKTALLQKCSQWYGWSFFWIRPLIKYKSMLVNQPTCSCQIFNKFVQLKRWWKSEINKRNSFKVCCRISPPAVIHDHGDKGCVLAKTNAENK